MSEEASRLVRGFGSLADRSGGITWNLGGGGAIALSGNEVSAERSLREGSAGEWSYEAKWDTDPLDGAGVFRHVAIEAQGGASILVTSIGSPGIEGHGLERTEAVLTRPEESIAYDEALLSTQYDGDGHPTRFGLELWPGDDSPLTRVAAALIGGVETASVWAGFFRSHTDGTEGLGTYVFWRP